MAKKRLSAVTKVTTAGDNDYIVMNTSEGKTVQIKKTDMSNAMADVMRTVNSNSSGLMPANGFIYRGRVVEDSLSALNNAKASGYYWHGSGLYGTGNGWHGVLVVLNAENYIIQIDYPMGGTNSIYYRRIVPASPEDYPANWITVG